MSLLHDLWSCEDRTVNDGPSDCGNKMFSFQSSVVLGQWFWLNGFPLLRVFSFPLSGSSLVRCILIHRLKFFLSVPQIWVSASITSRDIGCLHSN